jgi:hypothetical protein
MNLRYATCRGPLCLTKCEFAETAHTEAIPRIAETHYGLHTNRTHNLAKPLLSQDCPSNLPKGMQANLWCLSFRFYSNTLGSWWSKHSQRQLLSRLLSRLAIDRITACWAFNRLNQHTVKPQVTRCPELLDPNRHFLVARFWLRLVGPKQPVPPRKVEAKIAVCLLWYD